MSRKLRVLLLQLPVPNNPILNTALASGYLKAYAYAQGLGDLVEIEIMPRHLTDYAGDALLVDEIVRREPDLLGASLYTWNSERSLAIIERVKRQLPHLPIVVGGPEVQRDNLWVLEHKAVTVAVIGEGEQTFVELLRLCCGGRQAGLDLPPLGEGHAESQLAHISGIAYRGEGSILLTPERVALDDLALIPSPYLAGYLELPDDGMLMVEVSRWCPYSCSFCLYGRNLGAKLGRRYFGLERVLAEIAWARERGIRRIHFVEANLNLVPLFWPLMRALEDLNADHRMTFYAELRGEHLTDEVVAALDRANVRYVEVGLQTANQAALKASLRRTDLQKWAAGTRRLYERQIEVFLDVILGLPADDAAGVAGTLAFLEREGLGPYDVFTLQVLPGTAVRREAPQYGLVYQDRPPYYVLATERLPYAELRRLRRELKERAGLDPEVVEGMPAPRGDALDGARSERGDLVERVALARHDGYDPGTLAELRRLAARLAAQVDVVLPAAMLADLAPVVAAWVEANPATVLDLYLLCEGEAPRPQALRAWREGLPLAPGYLDRVAVYSADAPEQPYLRASPRLFLVLPWVAQADPSDYAGAAQIIWRYDAAPAEALPLGAWRAAGGAGVWLRLDPVAPPAGRAALLREARAWADGGAGLLWAPQA